MRPAIVTSEAYLAHQMETMLGHFSQEVTILTMEQALLRRADFDCFILDEADTCIIDHGAIIDPVSEAYVMFWDLMEKESILLTATASPDFDHILNSVFGVKRGSYIQFDAIIKEADSAACQTEVEYHVSKTDSDFWEEVEGTVGSAAATEPVIVFADTKSKVSRIKDFAKRL